MKVKTNGLQDFMGFIKTRQNAGLGRYSIQLQKKNIIILTASDA